MPSVQQTAKLSIGWQNAYEGLLNPNYRTSVAGEWAIDAFAKRCYHEYKAKWEIPAHKKETAMTIGNTTEFDVPETPWDLIAEQRNVLCKLWNREDFDLRYPVIRIGWKWKLPQALGDGISAQEFGDQNTDWALRELTAARRLRDPELDVRYQLEVVRHEIDCLEAGAEVGVPLANTPAFDLIHFGTGPLATAFGAQMVVRDNTQPFFEPAVRTPEEVMRLKKPDLLHDGICPQILDRIKYYNQVTQGKVILTPCDTAGPWSIATQIWHYEDMLEAIQTAPEAVHYLLSLVTECIIEWYNIQESYIGRWGRTHSSFSWPWYPRGIGIGDDCMVAVSPATWEKFFLPYNNRLSREYGNMILYHCCMRYDTHFSSLLKTDGFAGFDATPEYNDFSKIQSTLAGCGGIWTLPRGPKDLEQIARLKGKVGILLAVDCESREGAIKEAKDFLAAIRQL